MSRIDRLRALLPGERVDCLLVARASNLRYLTGFTGSAGFLLVEEREVTFFTDGRYALQAAGEVRGARVKVPKRGVLEAVLRRLKKKSCRRIGFEAGVSYQQYRKMADELGARRLRPVADAVERLRLVKDEREIAAIRAAVELNSRVLAEVLPLIRVGMKEADMAAEIEFRMRRAGADKAAFETIVASGPHAAMPHARPTTRSFRKNEFIVLDQGAILAGYASDMTRTVHLGRPGRAGRELYATVLEAHQQAKAAVRAGVSCRVVDKAARAPIEARGWGQHFPHSTGHGLGLDVHEMPRIAAREKTILPAGAVVTIEPGVYLPGTGGVRIEDLVVVRENGAETLTPSPKELLVIR